MSHSRAVGLEKTPALKRIIWGHNPSRARLKQQKKAPDGTCTLCGEKDTTEHFLSCRKVNESKPYGLLQEEMRHRAHSQGAPDHLINTISEVMKGE